MNSRAFVLTLAASCALVASSPVLADSTASFGTNLVVNGDAEAQLGAPDTSVVKPSGWKLTGNFTAVQYGASGGFPDATTPGPKERGKSLFEGGDGALATATQTISLATFASDIDNGGVTDTFSGWLGGYTTQGDYARVTATFKSATGASLGSLVLGPVGPNGRGNITSSVAVSKTGTVPKGARSAVISIVLTRTDGAYNDASVDNLSLVLTKK